MTEIVVGKDRISCWKRQEKLSKEIVSSAAQQLLCNRTSAVVRLSATCCALVKRLLCSKLSNPFIIFQFLIYVMIEQNKVYLGVVRVVCWYLKKKKVRFNRSFSMKGVLVSIICCIFANGFGYCHFQDIVGKQKHSLLFRVQPKASETYWK